MLLLLLIGDWCRSCQLVLVLVLVLLLLLAVWVLLLLVVFVSTRRAANGVK